MGTAEMYGFACTHWALGGLVLVALAASEYSGAGTVVALPIAAFGISCAALCSINDPTALSTRRRYNNNILQFFEIWLNILEHLVSAATCARVASATVDYSTGGRMRDWLFGWENHSLGEPWPDVLGISIIAVISTLFMLGLEKSSSFCILLFCGVFASFTFFVSVGSYHTDIIFWNWTHDFKSQSWGYILTTAAMCSFGFANSFPSALSRKPLKIAIFILLPLLSYSVIALIFTFMSHYREVAGTAIPLVRVFEVRDVDWARPVMASCTICVVCLALTEIMPSLYNLLVKLAGGDWKILVSPIVYRNSLTGAPVLAIFTAGSLTSILAFACPLYYLVRLVNIASLLKCSLKAILALHIRYKPEYYVDDISVLSSSIQYSMLNQAKSSTRKRKIYDILPAYLRKNKVSANAGETRSRKSPSGDKEYLLLNHYNNMSPDNLVVDEDGSESDVNEMSLHASDEEESANSTDIDAVVQEYKERIQVATINTFTEKKSPTVLTSRVVSALIFIIGITSSMLSLGISLHIPQLAWASISILLLCLFGIYVMPQNILNQENIIVSPIIYPLMCIIAIIINTLLATTLFEEIWPAIILWIFAGIILYSRCKCCGCCEEVHQDRIPFNSSKTECSIAECSNNHEQKCMEVDTILIPR